MSQKRRRSASPSASTSKGTYRSTSIKDRESTFIGYFSPTATDTNAKALQSQQELASASHRVAAWRVPSKQTSVQPGAPRPSVTGHDDDGEKWAGQKLERVLQEERAHGALVVARWYGGIMLGPVRFTHIEKCAREAINAWRDSTADAERELKRQKDDDDAALRLRRELPDRDRSIAVLRQLLSEKTKGPEKPDAKDATATNPTSSANADCPSPAKAISYDTTTVDVLRRLEKARDTTIALLLRKIDEAEKRNP